MARCPDCEAKFPMDEDGLEEGDAISCPECAAELEVTHIDPLRLELADLDFDEGEDGYPIDPADIDDECD